MLLLSNTTFCSAAYLAVTARYTGGRRDSASIQYSHATKKIKKINLLIKLLNCNLKGRNRNHVKKDKICRTPSRSELNQQARHMEQDTELVFVCLLCFSIRDYFKPSQPNQTGFHLQLCQFQSIKEALGAEQQKANSIKLQKQ